MTVSGFVFFLKLVIGIGTTANAYLQIAVQITRLALLSAASKALTKQPSLQTISQEKLATVRSNVEPRRSVYGRDLVSGPLCFINTQGSDRVNLFQSLILTAHECDAITEYWVDVPDPANDHPNTVILASDIAGGTFNVLTGLFAEVDPGTPIMQIYTGLGEDPAPILDPLLNGNFPILWTAGHDLNGTSNMTIGMHLQVGHEDRFKIVPQIFRSLIDGKQVYDPRRFALNEDPAFLTAKDDIDSPTIRWFRSPNQSNALANQWSIAGGFLTINDNADLTDFLFSERMPIDITKLYTVRVDARQPAGDRTNFLLVAFYDSAGDNIQASTSDATGWTLKGTYHYWVIAEVVFAASLTEYSFTFGVGGTGSIPTGAVTFSIGGLFSRTGAVGTATTIDLQDMAVYEGTARHDLQTGSTWEWSENPALCVADYLRARSTDYPFIGHIGFTALDAEVGWPNVIIAAQICDELVAIPTASTQKRYTCNGIIDSSMQPRDIIDSMVESMLGRIVYATGIWQMFAGAALASTITLSEKNLRDGEVALQPQSKHLERWNRVRGKYINPVEFYQPTGYIEQRSATFEADDGGEPNYKEVDFNFTKNEFECQRNAIAILKKSRNQRVIVLPCNWSALRLQPGITVDLDLAVFGFVGEKFMVTEWKLGADGVGIDLVLVQETDSVWADPLEGDYIVKNLLAIGFNNIGVPPPTGLTASAIEGGVLLSWTNPLQQTFDHIEIHAANENVRASAVLIDTTQANTYFEVATATQRVRYYWIRAVDEVGRVSVFEPDLGTTTAFAFPFVGQSPITPDPFIRQGAALWNFSSTGGGSSGYLVGGGVDGTDAIRVQSEFIPSPGAGFASYKIRRGPDVWDPIAAQGQVIEVRVRVQVDGTVTANPFGPKVNCTIASTEENGLNPRVYSGTGGKFMRLATDGNKWFDTVYTIFIDNEPEDGITRYLNLGFSSIAGSVFEYDWNIDFVDATFASSVFNPTGDQLQATGLVPASPDILQGRVLKDAGGWGLNPGGQTQPDYAFSTTTTAADPGAGIFRFDNATPASVTNIYISSDDLDLLTNDVLFGFLAIGNRIYIEQGDDNVRSHLFQISGAPVDNTGWWTIPVSAVATDTLPDDAAECGLVFTLAGGGGAGITRIAGSSGAAGADITWQKLTADATSVTSTLAAKMTTTGVGVGTWHFKYTVIYQSDTTTVGVRFGINHSGTVGEFAARHIFVSAGQVASVGIADGNTAVAAAALVEGKAGNALNAVIGSQTTGVAVADEDILATIEGIIVVTDTGQLELLVAREAASGTITIKEDTILELNKIG